MVHDVAAAAALLVAMVLAGSGCDRRLAAHPADGPASASAQPAASRADEGATAARSEPAEAPASAVVELFTSEGCSSCPPADAVLTELADDTSGRGLVALSFHVDYWNELGWPDPWSSAAHTARQEQYARALGGRGLYTPQMVVNGRDAFVGSDAEHARQTVRASLSRRLPIVLEASAHAQGSRLNVSLHARPLPPSSVVHVAIAEPRVVSRVARGENGGRTLHHTNVVRVFRTVSLDRSDVEVALEIPADLPSARALVVAYAQSQRTMEVLGAARLDPLR